MQSILRKDQELLHNYCERIYRMDKYDRTKKRKYKEADEVDMFLEEHMLHDKATETSKKQKVDIKNSKWTYWNSPEAICLFQPHPDESVLDCLSRRIL